ncbi:hypothetical protein DTO164E3_8263 [Paecilomyces variotii]|nr:hypothetical protein DTO164E3_8263 [Paecilomyces variotii]
MASEQLTSVELPTIRIRDSSPESERQSKNPVDTRSRYTPASDRTRSASQRRTISGHLGLDRIPEIEVSRTISQDSSEGRSVQSLRFSRNYAAAISNRRVSFPLQIDTRPDGTDCETGGLLHAEHSEKNDHDHQYAGNLLPAPASRPLLRETRVPLSPLEDQTEHYPLESPSGPRAQRSTSLKHVSRSKSILGRLGPLRSPDLRSNLSFQSSKSRRSAYEALDYLADDKPGDAELVDISFFEGPLNIKWNRASEDQASDNQQEPTIDSRIKLGDGVRVGAELSVGPVLGGPERPHSLRPQRESKRASLDRTATVRRYGQQLAEKNNIIVSVKESPPTIDLSSLEGTGYPESSSSGSLLSKTSTTNLVQKSYFYPSDPEQPDWKPFPMSSIYIIMLVLVSLTLAIVQEYLCQRSMALENEGTGLISYDSVSDIPTAEFFCWKYLPTIVMVSYGVLWQITDYEVKRLEPYYQLSQPMGNTAAKTINLDYISLWSYLVPYKALQYRHWAVFVSSFGTVLATTVAPSLQNPSVAPIPNPTCDTKRQCPGQHKFFVQIHPVWSRILTACLILVAIFALVLLFQLRRKSGLLTDPKGIAGIASMATRSHILTDFTGMEEAREDEIHKKLKNRHYLLYKSTIWQGEYMRRAESDLSYTELHRVENPHPMILRRNPSIALITLLIIFLALIPIITYTDVNVVVAKVPWLPTLITTIIKQFWSTLEFSVRMLEPFYILSRGNARPELTLTLDYKGTPYGLLPFQAFFNRHYLVALLGLGSIMGDILTVTASSLYLKDETPRSFIVSSTLSIIITAFLILSASLVLAQRRHAFLPRQPSTIASILAFIYQSRMLDDFVGTERFNNSEMEALLAAKNKRYGLGWFKGRDKKPHCAVDEEPMLSRYVHGVSYIRAQAPWEEGIGV